ncbi:MAG: type II toxin-antitoxin system VapC family toxin [Dehalococcoidia bacterium]
MVDASVATSTAVDVDAFHVEAMAWWRRVHGEDRPVHAPSILVSEVAAAVGRRTGSAQLARAVIEQLTSDTKLVLVDCDIALCTRAAELASDLGLRGCDSLYVALAERLGEPLITFDGEQLTRGAAVITVLRPE